MLDFRLLGPVEVWAGDRRIALGPAESAKTRCMLAVLLRTPGALVTTDALIDRVWGEQPPGSAVRYKYIGWLRSALAPNGVSLARQGPGYVLEVAADQVDLHRFRQLIAGAQDADKAAAVDDAWHLADEALGLWRGTAFRSLPVAAGLAGPLCDAVTARDWRAREDALATGIEVLVAAQHALGLPVPASGLGRFWARSYCTLNDQIWKDLLEGIADPEVAALPRGIGCVERWVDSAGLLASPRRRAALHVAYRAWSAIADRGGQKPESSTQDARS